MSESTRLVEMPRLPNGTRTLNAMRGDKLFGYVYEVIDTDGWTWAYEHSDGRKGFAKSMDDAVIGLCVDAGFANPQANQAMRALAEVRALEVKFAERLEAARERLELAKIEQSKALDDYQSRHDAHREVKALRQKLEGL